MTTVSVPLFKRPTLALLLAAGAIAFGSSFVFLTRDNTASFHPDVVGPTTYSRSAIGHAAVYRMLTHLGLHADVNRSTAAELGPNDVLVLAEPARSSAVLDYLKTKLDAGASLFVLPKRFGAADRARREHLGEDTLIDEPDVRKILALIDPDGSVVRPDTATNWKGYEPFDVAPTIRSPQLVTSKRLRPLMWSDEGVLVGDIRQGHRNLVLLSDPDVISNHAVARGANAAIVFELIRSLRTEQDGAVVFDEAIHGFTTVPGHSAEILFEFPFVLVTIQIAIAAALLLWAASARFGAPRRPAASLGVGTRSLVEHGARLLVVNDDVESAVDAYREATIREVAVRLHAPRGLDLDGLKEWMSRTGRPVPATGARRGTAAFRAAVAVYTWKRQALGESERHPRSH